MMTRGPRTTLCADARSSRIDISATRPQFVLARSMGLIGAVAFVLWIIKP